MNLTPPTDLYVSNTGEIRCLNHMPPLGSHGWTFGGWRRMATPKPTATSPSTCPTCTPLRRQNPDSETR